MTTRIGKIGRLPREIRNELGQRIEDGQPGIEIVKWLNGLPDVQDTLKDYFASRPITEQNLSDWKQTGHLEWLRREERRQLARELTEQFDDLDDACDGGEISETFAPVLATEMARLAMLLLQEETDLKKKWQILREVRHELSQLRRDDHRAEQVAIKREQWEKEVDRVEEEKDQRRKERRREQLMDGLMVKKGDEWGELMHRVRFDLPLGSPRKSQSQEKTNSPAADRGKKPGETPAKNEKIQPNPA